MESLSKYIQNKLGLKTNNNICDSYLEIEKTHNIKILCICDENESDSLCPKLDKNKYEIKILKGGHHFSGDYKSLAKLIIDWVGI